MPKPPGWIDTFNFVVFYAMNPCDTTLVVYAQTAKKATGRVALTLVTFGMLDVVRGFFRPKGLRSGRHGRKSRRGKIRRPVIPEIAEEVASRIPGAKEMKGREVHKGVHHLWKIDNFVQKISYHMMIIDIIEEFSFEMLTGIISSDQSSCPTLGRALFEGQQETVLGILYWNPINLLHVRFMENGPGWNKFAGSVPDGKWMITWSAKARGIRNPPATCQLKLTLSNHLGEVPHYSERIFLGPEEEEDLIVHANVRGPCTIRWEAGGGSGNWDISEGTVFIMQVGT